VTEEEARRTVEAHVGEVALARLDRFVEMVRSENCQQNLIAPASEAVIWTRHVLDSVQLLRLAPEGWERWIDVGTGGGFPGLAIAACVGGEMILVEPRKRRAAFLESAAADLGLENVRVVARKVEQVDDQADVISARAVASADNLLHAARSCGSAATRWILPRGRIDDEEIQALRRKWKGLFHVEPSMTDPNSGIIVGSGVALR
jgi:16S rRNA (guanine527-N7)-methyltransferase